MQSMDETKVLSELPQSLKLQLALILNKDFLASVPIFQGIDSRCIAVLVQAMRAKVYLPGETVVLAGKTVDALFFVVHGVVDVVVASKLVAQLHATQRTELEHSRRHGRGGARAADEPPCAAPRPILHVSCSCRAMRRVS